MAETPKSVQAAPLEVPVTIQGSRTVEGSDQRELFVESTKTTLVFDSGAVLSLKTKIAPGQCVFLRNEETGKEILCKVLESRQQGDSNYADLEFTVYEPDFWNGHAEAEEGAEKKSEAQKRVEAAVANLAASSKVESPAPVLEEAHTPAPLPEVAERAETPAAAAPASAEEGTESKEPAEAENAETHAETKHEGASEESHDAEAELAAMEPADAIVGDLESEAETEPSPKKKKKQRAPRPPNFKARKIAAAVSVTLAVAVISFQVYSWRGRIFHLKNKSAHSADKTSKQPAASSAANATTTPASAAAATTPEHPAKPALSKNATPTAPVAAAKAPSISTKALASPASPAAPLKAASIHQPPAAKSPKRAKTGVPDEAEIVPAQILSQPQPSMPPWAKKLDLDGVVTLDAVIDEKGNVTQTTPISGPPVLQHSAEEAVVLWIFQPATQDGKPVASHLVLTVEFQRPVSSSNR